VLTTAVAQFLPWGDTEIIPVSVADEFVSAQVAGGLFNIS
jgi:hypothetical protein